jgi:hypothetical protein
MPQISKFMTQLHSWMPEGEVKHVGWVVVGVGAVVVVVGAGRVVVVVGSVVVVSPDVEGVVPPEVEGVVVVVDGLVVVDVLVEVVGEGDVVVVVGSTTRLTMSGLAVAAKRPTSAAEERPEPTRTPRESRRTRASRRSRCWGVGEEGVMGILSPPVLWRNLKVSPRSNKNWNRAITR